VDVDMESVNDGCYLWGTLTARHRGPGGGESTYLPFVNWHPVPADGEVQAFMTLWAWLSAERASASGSNLTFRAYCYSQGAENGQLRRIADRCGLRDEVDEFIASDQWVDLHVVVKDQLITGGGLGLKVIAPLAGFQWRFDDAGGGQAMVQYGLAISDVDDAERAQARQWILEYNEDDVRATAALRDWLDSAAGSFPSITDWVDSAPGTV
jgi:predicted RecB family nuclease